MTTSVSTGSTLANVADIVFANAREDPVRPAVRGPLADPRLVLTRADLAALTARRAAQWANELSPGERIVLICPTTAEFVVEFFGAQAAGLVVVPVNPLSTQRELAHFLSDSGAAHVVAHPACNSAGRAAAQSAGVAYSDIELFDPAGLPTADWESFQPLRSPGDSPAVLLYTSGTTGSPKGAVLTVSNIIETGIMCSESSEIQNDDASATALPLFHVFGLASMLMSAITAGVPITLLPRFDAVEFLRTLEADRITITGGVPTMWNAVVHAPGEFDVSGLRLAISGGASIAVDLMRRFNERFDARICEGYGLTETTANATVNPWDGKIVPGSVGLPTNGQTEIAIKDDAGNTVGPDTVGEVCIKGLNVMPRYWNNETATNNVFDDEGFFHTGDLGRLDAEGYLFIVDRLKDLIIHGGYNVYPREVEEVLYEHPGILEAAVVGTPDEKYGQTVTAVITPMPGVELTEEEIEAYTREQLAAYKIPRRILFVESLPKGATGKILKRAIDLD